LILEISLAQTKLGRLVEVEEDIQALRVGTTYGRRDEPHKIQKDVCPNTGVTVLQTLVTTWEDSVFPVVLHYDDLDPITFRGESLGLADSLPYLRSHLNSASSRILLKARWLLYDYAHTFLKA